MHLQAHSHGAAVLHAGIYRPFNIKIAAGPWQTCRCAILPANTVHELDFLGGIHGKLFVERDSVDFLYFKRRFPYREHAAYLFEDAELLQVWREIYEQNPPKAAIENRLDKLLRCEGQLKLAVDTRIQAAIDLMHREPDRNFSLQHLATMADLSPSRFQHLFKENTDVSYRRFRTWKRLFLLMENLHGTDNMTRAALDAGFADAAHFSHSFRDTFGINPAFVFRGIERFEVG